MREGFSRRLKTTGQTRGKKNLLPDYKKTFSLCLVKNRNAGLAIHTRLKFKKSLTDESAPVDLEKKYIFQGQLVVNWAHIPNEGLAATLQRPLTHTAFQGKAMD